jgi:hypothetical protein
VSHTQENIGAIISPSAGALNFGNPNDDKASIVIKGQLKLKDNKRDNNCRDECNMGSPPSMMVLATPRGATSSVPAVRPDVRCWNS